MENGDSLEDNITPNVRLSDGGGIIWDTMNCYLEETCLRERHISISYKDKAPG